MEAKILYDAKTDALKSVTQFLPPERKAFAEDLIRQYRKQGYLSDKQWLWVDKLTAIATGTTPKPVELEVGDFSGVIKLFKTAQQHIKYPKIVLQVDQMPISLSVAGATSKAPGTVNVTDGRPFGQNTWYGRVTPQGVWEQSQQGSDADRQAVGSFLKKFGQDPSGTAKAYGQLTGRCCFCNAKLTDEHSTAAGFGPTCAKNFGLANEWKAAQPVLEAA
jgi:hypothetical protein